MKPTLDGKQRVLGNDQTVSDSRNARAKPEISAGKRGTYCWEESQPKRRY